MKLTSGRRGGAVLTVAAGAMAIVGEPFVGEFSDPYRGHIFRASLQITCAQ